jgi:hypothetical protein
MAPLVSACRCRQGGLATGSSYFTTERGLDSLQIAPLFQPIGHELLNTPRHRPHVEFNRQVENVHSPESWNESATEFCNKKAIQGYDHEHAHGIVGHTPASFGKAFAVGFSKTFPFARAVFVETVTVTAP